MQACYIAAAVESRNYLDCMISPIIRNCIVNLAVENEDHAPILSATESEGPSIIGDYERDITGDRN